MRSPSARSASWSSSAEVRPHVLGAALEIGLQALQSPRVDQLAQILGAQQLAQQVSSSESAAALRSALGVSPSYI